MVSSSSSTSSVYAQVLESVSSSSSSTASSVYVPIRESGSASTSRKAMNLRCRSASSSRNAMIIGPRKFGSRLTSWTNNNVDVDRSGIGSAPRTIRKIKLKLNPSGSQCVLKQQAELMKLNSGAYYIPKNNPKYPQGGDAHFISDNTIGVADGVGSWFKRGIDSGEYSRQLVSNSLISIMEQVHFNADPMRVLREAFSNTNAQGSSTACILTLTNDKVQGLSAVNVGDSGFIVLRRGCSIYHSPTQQHYFNCPSGGNHDTPSSADVLEFKEVMSGDVIVMGTDGLFDNLFTSEIEKTILDAEEEATSSGSKIDPKKVAQTLAEFALKKSLDPNNPTPYAEAKKKDNSLSIGMGGKVDDITVIVSCVI